MRLNNVMNGLIRADVLARTSLMKPYFASDVQVIGELCLYGKFTEIPEYLFFRRMDRSSALNLKSYEEQRSFHDPDMQSLMLFQNWKLHSDYFRSAWRAPLRIKEKLCVLTHLSRQALWARSGLWNDLRAAVGQFIRRIIGTKCQTRH